LEPCARGASTDWYFAEGTTVKGAQESLALFNPFGDDAIVDVSLLTDSGPSEPDSLHGVVVPRQSRLTLALQTVIERQPLVAAPVHARVGRVVAERSQVFDGTVSEGVPVRKGIAVSLGTPEPQREWRLPYGGGVAGVTEDLVLANFTARAAAAEVVV